jgi:transglutaminase-like putative cysteine protease
MTLKLNADKTGEFVETRRIKVLSVAALQQVAQQNAEYVEGMQSFEIVAAFTEKVDGTRVPVDLATVITRDAATGLAAVYVRDVKLVTVIFPDVAVGDTLVLSTRRVIHSDTFAGQFEQAIPFARSVTRTDSTVRVIAPSNLPLRVGVQGDGMEHTATAADNETQHVIVYHPRPMAPVEDRMTSPLDRDPAVFVSTFANYEELARSYWDAAHGAIEVTPEIARLADEITRGIDDRRGQAEAISLWVKNNIRYVYVALGITRVVPNAAAAVLKNRYGDCKDHAVLMSALLAAKGIAVEHVLINGLNAYTLPEPATMAYLNHVILYLPELGVYDDPTARFAAFGVLGEVEYDKPVVHVSDRTAYRARIPAMKSEEHVSTRRTRISYAADGTVSGQTEQTGTGIFATVSRATAASIQAAGFEQAAENALRRLGDQGKGKFDIDPLTLLHDPYAVRATFTYGTRFDVKPPVRLAMPTGLGILVRPGDFVLATRIPGRKLPFICLAATQVEEIELAFAEGLPLPQKIDDRRVDSKSFSYHSEYKLEDRTLKVRREFVSHVSGQVCPPELEAEVGQPMRDVIASSTTAMVFPAPPAAPQAGQTTRPPAAPATPAILEVKRTAVVDQPLRVDFLYSINPDCSSAGAISIRTVEEPKHGTLTITKGAGFSAFPLDNPRQACNRRRSEGMLIYYRPESGYLGPDSVTLDIIFPNGFSRQQHYAVAVNPKPAPTELTRTVAAEQQARIGFLSNISPDCSSTPFADVRLIEEPKHGQATLKQDTGFTNFAKENPRFECNKQRSEGTALLYQSEDGYTGKDSVVVELLYAEGNASSVRYSIDVK